MAANEKTPPNASESPRRQSRFSPGRVVLALLLVAFVGVVAVIACEMLASSRASSIYHKIEELIQQGESRPAFEADVNEALQTLPSHSHAGEYEFQDDYVIDGLFSAYTVRVIYWQFKGEKYKKLAAVKMFKQNRFFHHPEVPRGAW